MKVREIMSDDVTVCTPDASLQDVAKKMVEQDCGMIPVVEDEASNRRVVGVITDRDIVSRVIAQGKNPLEMKAGQVMSTPAYDVQADDDLRECERIMEEHLVRRVVVKDSDGSCCGVVAQADIARNASARDIAEVLREVSQPVGAARR